MAAAIAADAHRDADSNDDDEAARYLRRLLGERKQAADRREDALADAVRARPSLQKFALQLPRLAVRQLRALDGRLGAEVAAVEEQLAELSVAEYAAFLASHRVLRGGDAVDAADAAIGDETTKATTTVPAAAAQWTADAVELEARIVEQSGARRAMVQLADLSQVDALFTDATPPEPLLRVLAESGGRCVVAD